MKKVVVVESPSKAKTINKYLGEDYQVLASYGHVRDLPSKSGSVDPDHDFKMIWESAEGSEKNIDDIAKALKKADTLYLATDPDREGEAISWHVQEVLKEKKLTTNLDVKRVVFFEVTKNAVKNAIENPRELNPSLVDAYLARRALDYLVGFSLSPLLWHKLPGSRSAGRVQSVALRLIAQRETEIDNFKAQEYWTVAADFEGEKSKKISAKLTHLKGEKLDKFSLNNEKLAHEAETLIQKSQYKVNKIEKKQVKRNPAAPFITSTLQQEASRKLGYSARKTMQLAQKLYEGVSLGSETIGLITYMRTDSVTLANEAIANIRSFIQKTYGDKHLPGSPRTYKSSTKNAQEAHEAIRPTDFSRSPTAIQSYLEGALFKLYDLIWKRTVASQMESAVIDQVGIDFSNQDRSIILRATGSTISFDGFLKVYEEGKDDEENEENRTLPSVTENEPFDLKAVHPEQHFTQPPPRFTEASLVKKLEELGIGRPSTYASILSTLVDRKYVHIEKRQMVPEPLGRLVTAFLEGYFKQYVEYDFTAKLEEHLDEIANGKETRLDVLRNFWHAFHQALLQAKDLKITDVINRLNQDLSAFIFAGEDQRDGHYACPKCSNGELSLKLGKYGAFVGCSNYPECNYTRQLVKRDSEQTSNLEDAQKETFETRVLGLDPKTDTDVSVKKGPYGFYLEWALKTVTKNKKEKPKRLALPKGANPQTITLDEALAVGALPRTLGNHPETKEPVTVGIGRFGPYIKHNNSFTSLGKDYDVMTVTLDEALAVLEIAKSKPKRPRAKAPVKKSKKKK